MTEIDIYATEINIAYFSKYFMDEQWSIRGRYSNPQKQRSAGDSPCLSVLNSKTQWALGKTNLLCGTFSYVASYSALSTFSLNCHK